MLKHNDFMHDNIDCFPKFTIMLKIWTRFLIFICTSPFAPICAFLVSECSSRVFQ